MERVTYAMSISLTRIVDNASKATVAETVNRASTLSASIMSHDISFQSLLLLCYFYRSTTWIFTRPTRCLQRMTPHV